MGDQLRFWRWKLEGCCVCDSGGRHALALTVDGKVFSWGEGDDGKLGHFSRM